MIILASASPRRRDLLEQIGARFRVSVSEAAEEMAGLPPRELTLANARAKALTVAATEKLPVLGADTIVVLGEKIFGKPQDDDDAAKMLSELSGRQHEVITGLALVYQGRILASAVTTEVYLAPLSYEAIERYVRTGEPRGKAGAYAIQGKAAAFIEKINGSYSNVVGLPLHEVCLLAEKMGIDLWA